MKEKIALNEDHIIELKVADTRDENTISIQETYYNGDDFEKAMYLAIADDFLFLADTDDKETTTIEFEIDRNHPLYESVKTLLEDKKEIVIDDESEEMLKRYVKIKKEDKIFKFVFVSHAKQIADSYRFAVFVNSVAPTIESKMTDYSIKIRLIRFFMEVKDCFLDKAYNTDLKRTLKKEK